MKWYLKVMNNHYADFNGRARRKEYWMFTLFVNIFIMTGVVLGFVLSDILSSIGARWTSSFMLFLSVAFVLAHIIPHIALTIRRLHDIGKSGWFLLLVFIPYIGGVILFIFTVIEGEKNENMWGPDPKKENFFYNH